MNIVLRVSEYKHDYVTPKEEWCTSLAVVLTVLSVVLLQVRAGFSLHLSMLHWWGQ